MRPLKTGDPSSIAGFRLIGRLGAGGMGVVYLARSGRGTLCALKVIRAEHASDPGFRARFRREALIAQRVTGPWVVRVTGADPEAHEPWLATEFVPGPSLQEAVAAQGPLPERTVRALGARLADALAGAHAEGLIHRDVKPGNVLLALDGPRLIDFGIARSSGATALTATDVMIGSPGYLSPEQARAAGAGEVGPASDVFSLGCVLAHAASGRRPFGTGTVAAIVFRTVHEEPDLEGVPHALLPLIRSCLAKDPAARPTAREAGAALTAPPAGSGAAALSTAPPAAAPPAGGGAGAGGGADWLPDGLPALIAERSARALGLPVPEPTVVVSPAAGGAGGKPSRRRLLALGTAAASALAAGGVAAWFAGAGDPAPAGTVGEGPLPRRTIGVQADLTGPHKADGRTRERAARLAAETFNARPDRPFDLILKVVDDGGAPARALPLARTWAADSTVLAVLDLTTRRITRPVALSYLSRRLPVAMVSGVGAAALAPDDRRAYIELRPDDKLLVTPVSWYFGTRRTRRVAVVDDRAGGASSWNVVRLLREVPGIGEIGVHAIEADSEDFAALARAALTGRPDGVIYAGNSPSRAALLSRALSERGYRGLRAALESVLEPEFLGAAGETADGWVFGTSYIDPGRVPGAGPFLAAYRKRWRSEQPGRHAAESYDAVLYLAEAIRELGADRVRRAALMGRLREMTHRGVAKTLAFRDTTELLDESGGGLFLHRVEGGRARFLGPYRSVTAKT
ncbi:bifunctional serine/threonine-protein kinase/ABC transporter substrate-binding protein [Streptomyces sp. NPDC001985]|uniref:bifunctional serine/threonine-protein kinase/ABC transporter substrate-binding protein n=1 Tax=Streptomyces sp. NPDC001985 TaxID=3154406 RepID=UPI0033185EB1